MTEPYPDGQRGNRSRFGQKLERLHDIFQPPRSMQSAWFADLIKVPKRIMAASFVINMLGLGMPLVILQIYDRIIPNLSYDTLFYLMGGLVIVMLVDTTLKVIRSHISGWSSSYIDYVAGVEAVRRAMHAPPEAVEQEAASTHIDRMNALSATARMFAGPARMGLVDLPFIFVFLAVMAIVSPVIAGLLVCLFGIFAWRLLVKAREIQLLQDERQQLDRRKYDFVIEALSGIETIKTMACEPQMMRRYERLQESIAVAFHNSVRMDGETQSLSAVFAAVTMVTIVSSGALLVIEGTQSIGSLACCLLLGGRAVEVLVRSVRSWSEMSNFDLVKQNVDELLSINPNPDQIAERITLDDGAISVRNVIINSYMPNNKPYRVSLTIPHGSIIGLKGNLPRDDHQFLEILRGKLDPEVGEVLIGGYSSAELIDADLSSSIAYVPNSPAIFSGTILENLTLFNPRDGLQRAREATQLIGLESDIQQLPHGYDMNIGTGGNETLPPSFRQRICIARAIAQKPSILVLEEANALLDQRADNLLRKGLEQLRGTMTIVFLSNRPSFLAMADKQFILKEGQLQVHGGQQRDAADARGAGSEKSVLAQQTRQAIGRSA
ncbi:ATP-binding cassette, subfamily C, LapB [Cohaesibacter sp. ES.047]|uniref:ABC transporter transmembrane domain-containing protein n=1 Tax=Cohaesibacter sp. ES.047 TaxID=1798205 RepID=UPI000BBFF6E8|nr:ABC transporter transmembrane domain-containing protein [Cohaesibacter sp. ES.047]SNY90140.1 ATP-binding cassette, subfamily C, LapB [Cohaesibacter sp. ES.047]